MFTVYAISSLERNYIYVGLTDNLERRFFEHNNGQNKTTKPYKPFKIIFSENCETRLEARKLEKYFKSGIGKEKLKTIRDSLM
jgi:putative endonuclease